MDNYEEDDIIDLDDGFEDEVEIAEEDNFHKALRWAGGHKTICIASVILLPLFLMWLGAKMFSTHTIEQVEVTPPGPLDDYVRVPVSETVKTTYTWVRKDQQ